MRDFKHIKHRNINDPSKHIWHLKDGNISPVIVWSVVSIVTKVLPKAQNYCSFFKLNQSEKFHIIISKYFMPFRLIS